MTSRRRFLAASAAAGTVGLAGCNGALTGNGDDGDGPGQIGSGRAGRGAPGGTPMSAMADLEGKVTVYSGRSEVLVGELVGYIESLYDDLDLQDRYGSANEMVSQIRQEGDTSPADVFYSVNAGALGLLAESGRTTPLPEVPVQRSSSSRNSGRTRLATSSGSGVVRSDSASRPSAPALTE